MKKKIWKIVQKLSQTKVCGWWPAFLMPCDGTSQWEASVITAQLNSHLLKPQCQSRSNNWATWMHLYVLFNGHYVLCLYMTQPTDYLRVSHSDLYHPQLSTFPNGTPFISIPFCPAQYCTVSLQNSLKFCAPLMLIQHWQCIHWTCYRIHKIVFSPTRNKRPVWFKLWQTK